MTVRAKFVVDAIIKRSGGNHEIVLHPVTCGSEENKEFFKYTPYGEIRIGTINEKVMEQFDVDQEVYIDFTPIPKEK